MPGQFEDHARKRIVRQMWDTPILRWLYEQWGAKYFYFGLPGPAAVDIKLWREMIGRIVAFEVESEGASNPRRNIEELGRNLTLLGISHSVYCGFMEEVVLDEEDRDGRKLNLDDLVTLFNLDFCNRISGRIETIMGVRCRRFEAIREVLTIQRRLFRRTGSNKFVMFITTLDSLHVREVERFMNQDLTQEMRDFVEAILEENPLPSRGYVENTELSKAFVFSLLRDYLHGQNIQSVFLPPVSYMGRTARSPMIHFAVVCYMEAEEEAQVVETQSARDFLNLGLLRADERTIEVSPGSRDDGICVDDPVLFLSGFDNIA